MTWAPAIVCTGVMYLLISLAFGLKVAAVLGRKRAGRAVLKAMAIALIWPYVLACIAASDLEEAIECGLNVE